MGRIRSGKQRDTIEWEVLGLDLEPDFSDNHFGSVEVRHFKISDSSDQNNLGIKNPSIDSDSSNSDTESQSIISRRSGYQSDVESDSDLLDLEIQPERPLPKMNYQNVENLISFQGEFLPEHSNPTAQMNFENDSSQSLLWNLEKSENQNNLSPNSIPSWRKIMPYIEGGVQIVARVGQNDFNWVHFAALFGALVGMENPSLLGWILSAFGTFCTGQVIYQVRVCRRYDEALEALSTEDNSCNVFQSIYSAFSYSYENLRAAFSYENLRAVFACQDLGLKIYRLANMVYVCGVILGSCLSAKSFLEFFGLKIDSTDREDLKFTFLGITLGLAFLMAYSNVRSFNSYNYERLENYYEAFYKKHRFHEISCSDRAAAFFGPGLGAFSILFSNIYALEALLPDTSLGVIWSLAIILTMANYSNNVHMTLGAQLNNKVHHGNESSFKLLCKMLRESCRTRNENGVFHHISEKLFAVTILGNGLGVATGTYSATLGLPKKAGIQLSSNFVYQLLMSLIGFLLAGVVWSNNVRLDVESLRVERKRLEERAGILIEEQNEHNDVSEKNKIGNNGEQYDGISQTPKSENGSVSRLSFFNNVKNNNLKAEHNGNKKTMSSSFSNPIVSIKSLFSSSSSESQRLLSGNNIRVYSKSF